MIQVGDKVIYLKRKEAYRAARKIEATVIALNKSQATIELSNGVITRVSQDSLKKVE